jgi:hypothetical protein
MTNQTANIKKQRRGDLRPRVRLAVCLLVVSLVIAVCRLPFDGCLMIGEETKCPSVL